jgi:ribonucleoside-diphosphate reductase alpha chain
MHDLDVPSPTFVPAPPAPGDPSRGIAPTPPAPADLPPVALSDNARQVLERRYLRRGANGRPVESVEGMFWRVAWHVARAEAVWGSDGLAEARDFYQLLASKRFFPNSPTFTGAGTPLGQLAACFVLPIADDMGRDAAGIFQTLRDAALIQQTGGGNGFAFSRIRPSGAFVESSAGRATGPIGFLRMYNHAFGEVAQGGTRCGANMAVLRVDHPDIEAFITCKSDEQAITNFNISVGITDAFMRAVERDEDWELRFPDIADPRYRDFNGTLEQAEAAGLPIRVHQRIRARDLFDKIVRQAHHNGEPGLLFLDAANRENPVPHLYELEATNPCGEQYLGPYENCCLGSINLAEHTAPDGRVDWAALQATVALSTRFLDDVVEVNAWRRSWSSSSASAAGGRSASAATACDRSPTASAQVLVEYLEVGTDGAVGADEVIAADGVGATGDICPDCGHAALVHEEGCLKCHACGYSEC